MNTDSIPTQAVVVRESQAVGQALGVSEILAQVKLIQDVMKSVMHEGEHFGKVPGCGDKKVLLQPGAQKLTMTFRLCPEYEIQETDLPRGHKEYRVICTLKSMASGSFVGQGVGCCSSMESKYRWRGGARKCPQCGSEAIIKGKKEYGGGWLCFAKRGGCGAKWDDGAQEIESQEIEKVENDNPADTFNTVLKMAKKRAFVDATITATAASDIFTQDVGDYEDGNDTQPTPQKANTQPATPKPKDAPKAKPAPKQATNALADILKASKVKFIENVRTEGKLFDAWVYAVETGTILETEQLDDARVEVLFPSVKEEMGVEDAKIKLKADYETMMSDIRAHTILEQDHGTWHEKFTHAYNENKPKPAKKIEVPREEEPWRTFPMPWGKKAGVQLGKLDKKYLFGLWANYEVETEYNGKPKSAEQIAKDRTFRTMLDDAGEHYEFVHPDDKEEFRDEHDE
jgi:hypothetical protein